jgi:hypothetical protein
LASLRAYKVGFAAIALKQKIFSLTADLFLIAQRLYQISKIHSDVDECSRKNFVAVGGRKKNASLL